MEKKVIVALLEAADLSKLIGKIGKASVTLTHQIQIAACQAIAQSIVHRNSTPAQQLFEAVGTAHRRDALVAHFEKFGNLTWSKGDKKVIFLDMSALPGGKKLVWDEEYSNLVLETLWHKAKAEPQPKSILDIDEEAAKFLERMAKQAAKLSQTTGGEVKARGLLDVLTQAYQRWVGEQYLRNTTAEKTHADKEAEKSFQPAAGALQKVG